MPHDALDPGPNGNYPHAKRKPDGTLDHPEGLRKHPVGRKTVVIDVTTRLADGTPLAQAIRGKKPQGETP
jgi:hypothetical protein